MERSFWQARWDRNEIGFHANAVNPDLTAAFAALSETGRPPFAHALIPLCGKTLDLAWLAARVPHVTGVEFVPEAARAFFDEAGLTPRETRVGAHTALSHAGLTVLVADFFALTPADLAWAGQPPVDLAYDRAALIALPPADRARYAAQFARLVAPGGRGIVVTIDHDPALRGGPPFPVTDADLAALHAPAFDATRLHRRVPADPPRGLDGADVFTSTWLLSRR